MKISRLLNTIKYLKLSQLFFFILRRKFPAKSVSVESVPVLAEGLTLQCPIAISNIYRGDYSFEFLNVQKTFSPARMDWAPHDVQRLWRYNLHYFDYLRETERTDTNKSLLIGDWRKNNPQGSQPGWEPFTASLRIVNWIFYFNSLPDDQAVSEENLKCLYEQLLWLEKNDERHILANHYFENLKAMLFGGVFFAGRDAGRWFIKAVKGLTEQLKEQTLEDGGHYERTPQYHALMLENYLDLYNLVINNRTKFEDSFMELIAQTCRSGLEFLSDILFPDQKLPLFNDSAFGIAPEFSDLNQYAQSLLGQSVLAEFGRDSHLNDPHLIDKAASGLYGYRHNDDMFIIDCGSIGPVYQPGHTHCDFLSYELMFGGKRLIVDAGVCEYEPGPMRTYVRSTRAHNTVSVDQQDQSEVWGEFRVSRRARKLDASISQNDQLISFEGAYRGFYPIKGGVEHRRRADLAITSSAEIDSITIRDLLSMPGDHTVESFIHLHPDVTISHQEDTAIHLTVNDVKVARIEFPEPLNYRVEPSIYCPQFGQQITNQLIIISVQASLSCEILYRIVKLDSD